MCNLSASDEVIGKSEYRRKLVSMNSARTLGAYIYSDCGFGESTQDMVFAGHDLICENGSVLAETKKFDDKEVIYADIDLKRLAHERQRANTFETDDNISKVIFDTTPKADLELKRDFPRTPFVPRMKDDLERRCEEILLLLSLLYMLSTD